jgi:hypothetical protein
LYAGSIIAGKNVPESQRLANQQVSALDFPTINGRKTHSAQQALSQVT